MHRIDPVVFVLTLIETACWISYGYMLAQGWEWIWLMVPTALFAVVNRALRDLKLEER